MDDLKRLIGDRLRALRKDTSWENRPGEHNQQQLAERAGVSLEVVSRIERGETLPNIETLARLCRVLNVSLAEFFTFETPGVEVGEVLDRIRVRLSDKPLDFVMRIERVIVALDD